MIAQTDMWVVVMADEWKRITDGIKSCGRKGVYCQFDAVFFCGRCVEVLYTIGM